MTPSHEPEPPLRDVREIEQMAAELEKINEFEQAAAVYDRLIDIDSQRAAYFINRGVCHFELFQYYRAARDAKRALTIDPQQKIARLNLGNAYRALDKFENAEAEFYYLSQDLDCPLQICLDAKLNYGLCRLYAGDIVNGLEIIEEVRLLNKFHDGSTKFKDIPAAKVSEIARIIHEHKKLPHLLVVSDQGIGDLFQFLRYINWIERFTEKLTLAVQSSLYPLLALQRLKCSLVERDNIVDAQVRIPLSNLPGVWHAAEQKRTLIDDPYLFSPSVNEDRIFADIEGNSLFVKEKDKFKIGFCWRGNKNNPIERFRKLELHFLDIILDPRAAYYCLVLELSTDETDWANANGVRCLLDGTWITTCRIIQAMDLIITSCTAVCHLAGALGKEVWLITSYYYDWRWMDANQHLSYPKIKIWRLVSNGKSQHGCTLRNIRLALMSRLAKH